MSNDRELLEMAAKALGGEYREHALGGFYLALAPHWNGRSWNPAGDDGDCARMEAELLIDIEWLSYEVAAYSKDDSGMLAHEALELYVNHANNNQAARRMASVRIAAEIGKAMP